MLMLPEKRKISSVLKSLIPTNQEELSVLRFVLRCAEKARRSPYRYVPFHSKSHSKETDGLNLNETLEPERFLEVIPDESKKYFHGLLEAIDIYQSIYGTTIPIQEIGLSDRSVYELRQIRDMCLEEGLRSIY